MSQYADRSSAWPCTDRVGPAVHHLGRAVRTPQPSRQPSAAPEHRQMPRQSRPVGHPALAVAPLLMPQPRLVRWRFALLEAAAVLLPACLPAARRLDADLLYLSRGYTCVGSRDRMTSPARETLTVLQDKGWQAKASVVQCVNLMSAVGHCSTAMRYLSQHVVPDLPEVLHVCITSGLRCLCAGTAQARVASC